MVTPCQYFSLTSPEASLLACINLFCCQRHGINLHTRDTTSEVPRITNTRSHSHGVISGQSDSSNFLSGHKSILNEQLSLSCFVIVRCSNKLPSARSNPPAQYRFGETTSSTTCEPHEKHSGRNHPEVHSPAVRHVVEDGSGTSFMVDPSHQSYGSFCVDLSAVGELDKTV